MNRSENRRGSGQAQCVCDGTGASGGDSGTGAAARYPEPDWVAIGARTLQTHPQPWDGDGIREVGPSRPRRHQGDSPCVALGDAQAGSAHAHPL